MSTVSLSCFAVDGYPLVLPSDDVLNASAADYLDVNGIATLEAPTQPTYPDWDLSQIDLNTIPNDIYNIIHSDNRLIVIQVWQSKYRVFVLRNGFTYYYKTSGGAAKLNTNRYFGFGMFKQGTNDPTYDNQSCLYSAIYNYDGTISSDWTRYNATAIPQSYCKLDYAYMYTGELSADTCDFYQIGSSNFKRNGDSYTSGVFPGTTYALQVFCRVNQTSFSNNYLSTDKISFPTFDSQTTGTQKSILQRLKDLPDTIGEKLKSLFIPSDGYFKTYSEDLQNYFVDHFGFLYEIPSFFVGILSTLSSYSPNTSNYSISIPKIEPFYLTENGVEVKYVLIDEQTYTFDFLETGAFATLYNFYRSFIWLAYILMLFYLIWCKAQKIFGGGN